VLKTLFQNIITGRKSVKQAAKDASAQITKILNQPVT
jgi:maltose-binding protein MalE